MAKTQIAEDALVKRLLGYWNGSVQVTYSESDVTYENNASIFIHEDCQETVVCLKNLTIWEQDNLRHEMQYLSDGNSENQACFISSDKDYQACVSPLGENLQYSFEGPDFTSDGILHKESRALTPQPPIATITLPDILINDWNGIIFGETDSQRSHPILVTFKIIRNCQGTGGYCLYLIPVNEVEGLTFAIYPLRTAVYNQYCFGDGVDLFCFIISGESNIIYNCKKAGWVGNGKLVDVSTEFVSGQTTLGYTVCPGLLRSQLIRGEYAYIIPGLGANNLRSGPGLSTTIEGNIQPGTRIQILDGPVCSDSYIWWRVLVPGTNSIGWTAENSSEDYFMEPCQSASCEPVVQTQPGSDTCDPIAFLERYFKIIAKGNLQNSYKLLSDRFIKKHHSDGYQLYLNWWSTVERIEILSVNITSNTDKKAVLRTELRYYFRNGQIDDYDLTEFTIAWDSPDGSCMMDDEVLIRGYR